MRLFDPNPDPDPDWHAGIHIIPEVRQRQKTPSIATR